MLIGQQIIQFQALNKWFQTPLGEVLGQEFSGELEQVKEYLKGECLLQLGQCGDNLWLNQLKFERKWIASPFLGEQPGSLKTSLIQLPLKRNTVDCVIAPLTLEPFGLSMRLIDEIDRILKPMGYVILLSLNPWSLWGGAMKLGFLHCYENKQIKMRSPFNLNRIFIQRGYRQCALNSFCYIPPVTHPSLIKKLSFMDEIGKMIWPLPSGVYYYIAQKYEYIAPALILEPVVKKYESPFQPAI